MNEAMVYADSFNEEFVEEGDFLSFLKARKDKTIWKKEASNNLKFEALVKDTRGVKKLTDFIKEYGFNVKSMKWKWDKSNPNHNKGIDDMLLSKKK